MSGRHTTGHDAAAKSLATNPLRVSPALGGAVAFLGIERCLPLLHGAQGCTAFALVLAVRHFREAIPLQTTAIGELDAILGGADNVEQAIANIHARAAPRLIGLLTTALTETRDEDIKGDLRLIRARHPEWTDLEVVLASTPDFAGGFQDGWARAVEAVIEALVEPPGRYRSAARALRQVNLLAGSQLTPGDVEELKETIEAFGFRVIALPDLSGSLDGHVACAYVPTSAGGTAIDDIRRMGRSALTLAVGEQMRGAAELLQRRAGVPYTLFDGLIGLDAFDAFVAALIAAGGTKAPAALCRQRSRLVDAMLDTHACFGGQRLAIAGDPDLVLALGAFVVGMGARVVAAVSATPSPALARLPAERRLAGDLDDFEQAILAAGGCDLIVANSHAQPLAARLGVPLHRAGFPVFDRIGVAQDASVGYRGARALLFRLANLLIERDEAHSHAVPLHEVSDHERKDTIDVGRIAAAAAAH